MRTGAMGLLLFVAASAAAAEPPDFNRDVRPILSAHCFKCHGPDESVREAGLRLDQRDSATKPLDSGATAVVPGKPDDSELLLRVFSDDKDEQMPPPAANKPLSAAQKDVLKQWIAAGAAYQPHWAFSVAGTVPVPSLGRGASDSGDDTRSVPITYGAIDAFILPKLRQAGLTMSPQADRYTLIRRASLDLTGLPPTPEEADAFVSDAAPDAYERLIDRLLASPAYGERWARRWLDLARYADTNGYEKDRPRSMWPYRDWVIRALNADMPFDQFTIEQLAGDMLPAATPDQQIATGFHRNTMINEEGGIDPLEFRFHAMVDRINTTSTVWLGLTLGCAQCHTHKFDPIPHADYYRLLALLNNADEPMLDVQTPVIAAQRAEVERRIAELTADLPNRFPAAEGQTAAEHLAQRFEAWLTAERESTVKWQPLKPLAARSNLPTLTIQDDGSIFSSGDISKRDVFDVTFDVSAWKGITALKLEVLTDERLPKSGPGRIYYEGPPGDFWLSQITAGTNGAVGNALRGVPDAGNIFNFKSASHSFAAGKNTAEAAIDDDPQTGWSINGGQGRPHYAVFVLEQPLETTDALRVQLLFERYYAAALGKFRVWATDDPRGGAARDMLPEIEALLLVPPGELTAEQRQRLLAQFVQVAPELAAAREEIKKARDQLPAYPTTLVMQERPRDNRRPTHRHHRGEFLQPKETVEPQLLSLFPPPPDGAPHDRLSFARWLVSEHNPLVGRVTMNRHWAALFGTGIVRTTEDFGYQGEPPSHPELLDWLALELPRRGWSIKAMHRLIVSSATYRQDSEVRVHGSASDEILNPEHRTLNLPADPANRLLWHFPRTRLDAETVRDSLLAIGGLLSHKQGGASVFPPQPPGITTEGAYGKLDWNVSPGEDRYRRGLYTFMKRTAPYAMFATFDGPSGEACLARREVSNTPLQALTMLNDAVLVEAAQALGTAATGGRGSFDDRVTGLFSRCLARPPTPSELELLTKFHETQRQRLFAKELDAAAIAGPGDGDPIERAAWTLTARAILNLDEAITRE